MSKEINVDYRSYVKQNLSEIYFEIKDYIIKSELEFSKDENAESFLWEHTDFVASLSYYISKQLEIDPFEPVLTALFHDSGKFYKGQYHKQEIPEEEHSVEIAKKMLKNHKIEESIIENITESLLALYNEEKKKTEITKIIHDADFLVKFGFTGIATLFQKATLRGFSITTTMLKTFSKEYTYAMSLEKNMKTSAGKKIAIKKAKSHIKFLDKILKDFNKYYGLKIEKIENKLPCPKDENILIPFIIVTKKLCDNCNEQFTFETTIEKGLKCTKLIAKIKCVKCNEESKIEFCLPELCGGKESLSR